MHKRKYKHKHTKQSCHYDFLILCRLLFCCPIRNKSWCTVNSDTFLSKPGLPSSLIWTIQACLLNWTSSHSPHALVRMVSDFLLFSPWIIFDTYWPLWTRNIPQDLKNWRCSLVSQVITICHMYNLLKLLHFLISLASNTDFVRQNFYLLPIISHPLTDYMMKR